MAFFVCRLSRAGRQHSVGVLDPPLAALVCIQGSAYAQAGMFADDSTLFQRALDVALEWYGALGAPPPPPPPSGRWAEREGVGGSA